MILRFYTEEFVALKENYGAGVYYNTLVSVTHLTQNPNLTLHDFRCH